MPEIRRDWPAVARLNRRQARFGRRKRPTGRCASPCASKKQRLLAVEGVLGQVFPFRAVARTGRNWLVEGCRCRSGRKPSEHGLEGLGLMAVPSEAQVLASAVAAVDRCDVHQV